MKKILLLSFVLLFAKLGTAQITLLSQDFNSYDGDSANFLSGYYVSWNSPSGGMPSASYYSSTGNFGIAPNSYKFGIDSATIITPYFGSGADRVSFWYKGNGTGTGANVFYVYESADSITFTLLDSITSFPTTGTQRVLTNTSGTHYLKFVYHKVVGNVAFDDLVVSNNMGVVYPITPKTLRLKYLLTLLLPDFLYSISTTKKYNLHPLKFMTFWVI